MAKSKKRHTIDCSKDGRTRKGCAYNNPNEIMRKYKDTGAIPMLEDKGVYEDVSALGDYHDACNRRIMAKNAFTALDISLQNKFEGDPQNMIDFLSNPENREEAVKLGLVKPVKSDIEGQKMAEDEKPASGADKAPDGEAGEG